MNPAEDDSKKEIGINGEDMSLTDLEQSEQMLRESLFRVGGIAGLSNDLLEVDWQRIKLEAQLGDVHIDDL
jgi:hypothetical protein